VSLGIGLWFRGELGAGQYPEGTTAAEAKQIEDFVWVFGQFHRTRNASACTPNARHKATTLAHDGTRRPLSHRATASRLACVSLAMYAINVGLMDLPWALRYRCAVGDTSGLWQIAPIQAVIFTGVMVASRVLLVVFSA
jgi:hypothetical protein